MLRYKHSAHDVCDVKCKTEVVHALAGIYLVR